MKKWLKKFGIMYSRNGTHFKVEAEGLAMWLIVALILWAVVS